ncbi:MAG TPA: hypothetical protein VFJ58_09725 [Armatimonadota bacterium]|nr:hypothetical protein [Armatimonadota bacterium]
MSLPARWNRVTLVCMATLCMVYIALVTRLSQTRAFWSPDCGARFAMIRSWLRCGSLLHWPYASAALDPQGQIHPLAYFLFHQAHGWCAMYSPLFPLLSGVMYRLFGFAGLCIIPVASGLGTACILSITARQLELRCHAYVPLLIGLGTPVLIYSVVFWDHIVMIFLTAVAGYGMLRALQDGRPRFAALAGAALGFGIWIHELLLAVFLATLLAAVPLLFSRAGRRIATGLLIGFTPPALLWTVGNKLIYGNFGGPHLAANMGGNVADHPFGLKAILSLPDLVNRILTELLGTGAAGIMMTSSHRELFPWFVLLGALLLAYVAATWLFGARWPPASALCLAAAGVSLFLVLEVHWANGLFQATPLLIAALAIPWDAARTRDGGRRTEDGGKPTTETRGPSEGRRGGWLAESRGRAGEPVGLAPAATDIPPSSLFYAWASRTAWFYIVMILLNPMLPGVDWGARYLLPVLPLLVLLALHAFEEQYRAAEPLWRLAVVVCAAAVAVASVCCQREGLIMVQRTMRYNRDLINHARALRAPVIVYSSIGMGAEFTAARLPQMQYMARSYDDLQLLLRVLDYRRIREFTFVTDGAGLGLVESMEPVGSGRSCSDSRATESLIPKASSALHVDLAREDGKDLTFITFLVQRRPQVARHKK